MVRRMNSSVEVEKLHPLSHGSFEIRRFLLSFLGLRGGRSRAFRYLRPPVLNATKSPTHPSYFGNRDGSH